MLAKNRMSSVAAAAAVALAAGWAGAANAQPTKVPLDAETTVDGVPVACTGVGQTKLDPHWTTYPVRAEFSDAKNAYLANEAITVWDAHGRQVVSVSCEGPWILLKLAPGSYRIEGRLLDMAAKPRTAPFKPPAKGQMRLVLQFLDVDANAPVAP
jgi:hypothetical protein